MQKKIRFWLKISSILLLLIYLILHYIEGKSPFGVNAEYYPVIKGKFQHEFSAKETGFSLDRIRRENLENLKYIPHGILWSGYITVPNNEHSVVKIYYSGRIIVVVDKLAYTYANIYKDQKETLSFSLDKSSAPFKIAFFSLKGEGEFEVSVDNKDGSKEFYLTTIPISTQKIKVAHLIFTFIGNLKKICLIVLISIILALIVMKICEIYTKQKGVLILAKVFLISFLVYFIIAFFIMHSFKYLTGDEPHYLLIAHSIVYDHDVDLYNNYWFGEYYRFFPAVFVYPHTKKTPKLEMASSHGILLPLILAPAYGLLGKFGAIAIMAFIMTLNLTLFARLLGKYNLSNKKNLFIMFTVFFTPPLSFYSFSIYPETMVLMAILLYLNFFLEPNLSGSRYLSYLCLLIAIPHLHYKFFILIAIFYIFRYERIFHKGWQLHFLCEVILPLFAFLLIYGILYGDPTYYFTVLPKGMFMLSSLLYSSWGFFIEREFGIFPWSIHLILMLTSLPFLFRKQHINPFLIIVLFLGITGISAFFTNWSDGSPKGRFFVTIIPLLIPSLIYLLKDKVIYRIYLVMWLQSLIFSLHYLIFNPNYIYGYMFKDHFPYIIGLWRQFFPSIGNTPVEILMYLVFWLSVLTLFNCLILKFRKNIFEQTD
jgi:hypothetical protein